MIETFETVLDPREELSQFIAAQETRIGDVHTLHQQGLGAKEIAEHLDVGTSGFVYQCIAQINAALDGETPASASMLKLVASKLNALVKQGKGSLSEESLDLLLGNRARVRTALEQLDPADEARDEEQAEVEEQGALKRLEGMAGIYAFSYGWYLDNPLNSEADRTLIKVGRAIDVARRIRDHRRGARAHIPEPLVTIRVYETGDRDVVKVEQDFHRLLETAGHRNPRRDPSPGKRNEVGEEWYLTDRDFLDAIASVLGLRMVHSA